MDAQMFRALLAELNETQSSFARRMQKLGDDRTFPTILKSVQRFANGEARVSGEMRVILTLLCGRNQG